MTFYNTSDPAERRELLVGNADRYAKLCNMLSYRRPHKSRAEGDFIKQFIDSVPGMKRDEFGNRYITIGEEPAKVLWSCHTDTVHYKDGRQSIRDADGLLMLTNKARKKGSNCLGADDTAGCWLLLEMIEAGIPGLYIFHRGEECGGLGSGYIASKTPELVSQCKAAVAFDRKGYDSIITHQFGRTASDAFAESLGDALGMGHGPDSTGLFTDTQNYEHLIPECSNVSVGYHFAHGHKETQDWGFLFRLREAVLKLDLDKLEIAREPGDDDWYGDVTVGKGGYNWAEDPNNPANSPNVTTSRGEVLRLNDHRQPCKKLSSTPREDDFFTTPTMLTLVKNHPTAVTHLLEDYGITWDELAQAVYDHEGYLPMDCDGSTAN